MDRGPVLVVAACIVRGDSVLLARRNQPSLAEAHLKWELPGGKVRFKETPQDAIRREIEEELGTTINVVRLLPHLQTNVYHRADDTVGHFVIVAFESVIAKGAAAPAPADESVKQFRWIKRDKVNDSDSLPGTKTFVECIQRIDRTSFDQAHLYVRLERPGKGDRRLDYWEFQCVPDLFGDFNLLIRHVHAKGGSTKTKLITDPTVSGIWLRLTDRIRDLARQGYVVSQSTTPLLQPLR